MNRNDTLSFPAEIDFLLSWANVLADHASDADSRKGSYPSEQNKHYIDIDNFPEFISTGRIPQDFDSVVTIHGYNFVMEQGILPWTILETIDSLTAAFESYRWDRAMLFAADLGHYIGDAHMPLHITRNYNGQYTNQSGVHSRYESRMIEKYDQQIFYDGDSVAYISDVSDFVFNMIYNNYVYVDSVLIADSVATIFAGSTSSNDYYAKFWELSGSFTIRLFKSTSNKLAALIYSCWINAGSPDPRTNIYDNRQPIKDFVLYQNYPNPFNLQTNISFELKKQAEISIGIFNLNGQMVGEVFDGIEEAGYHSMGWDAGNVSAGIYIIKLEAENFFGIKKCLLLK